MNLDMDLNIICNKESESQLFLVQEGKEFQLKGSLNLGFLMKKLAFEKSKTFSLAVHCRQGAPRNP